MFIDLIPYCLIFFISYMLGAIPWAFIIGKCAGIDIRDHGSGNIGATNARRVLGKKIGIICFVLDFLKGLLPVLIVKCLIQYNVLHVTDIAIILTAFASVIGHMWPVYLQFKGGKGVSTIAGILLAIAPWSLLIGAILWGVVFCSSRYVSLASIVSATSFPLSTFVLSKFNIYVLSVNLQIMLSFIALLIIFRHTSNIKRLFNGTENKFIKKEIPNAGSSAK